MPSESMTKEFVRKSGASSDINVFLSEAIKSFHGLSIILFSPSNNRKESFVKLSLQTEN